MKYSNTSYKLDPQMELDFSNGVLTDDDRRNSGLFMNFNTSTVFDCFWRFAQERQSIFYKKILRIPYPWTFDPFLEEYKFTNAYRASDRVSQFLIRNVIYSNFNHYEPEDVLFRILLFKIFNKINTWEVLEKELGEISYKGYSFEKYDKVLTSLENKGVCIYSAAYIMPSGKSEFGSPRKHRNHLMLLEQIMKEKLSIAIAKSKSLEELFNLLLGFPSVGRFLAFQYAIDINYSELTDFDEMSFVMAGPGAIRGIKKCFPEYDGKPEVLIRLVTENQDSEFRRRGIDFMSLNGRKLQLIDCQNLFCEIDKYSRVSFPELNDGLRKRIKQKYKFSTLPAIDYFYPPKWGINDGFLDFCQSIGEKNGFVNRI